MRFGFRELFFVLLLLAMPIAAYFFVFEPRNTQNDEKRRELDQKDLKLQQLEAATYKIDDLGREIDKLAGAIKLFEQKLPVEREVEVILKQVWELAAQNRLTPKSVRTDKPITTAHYTELPISMVIIGDFDGFYRFMLDLEKLRRVTRMPKLKLKKLVNEQGKMRAELILSIFFEPKSDQSADVGLRWRGEL